MATQDQVVRQIDGQEPGKELSPRQQVAHLLQANKNKIGQILPKHVTSERLMQIAYHAVAKNEKLLSCDQTSLIGSVMQCAMLGLEPNTVLGQAYLIPFWNGRKRHNEVQFVMGYKGMITLARRSGQIQSITAQAVRENDLFEFEYGLDERLKHVPATTNRGEITHFYAYAKIEGGGYQFIVMTREDVDMARDASQGYQTAVKFNNENTPWISHYEPMGQKTAVRRLFKWLPCSIEMATAEKLDAQAEGNVPQGLETVLDADFSVIDDQVSGDALPDESVGPASVGETDQERQLREWGFYETDSGPVSKHGEVFDSELHCSNKEGVPTMNVDGTFRKRPTKPVSTAAETGKTEQPPAGEQEPESQAEKEDGQEGNDNKPPF